MSQPKKLNLYYKMASENISKIVPQNPIILKSDVQVTYRVDKDIYPEFLYTTRKIVQLNITDHTDRPYLDIPTILANFDGIFPTYWIETMPVQYEGTCYKDDVETIIDILHSYGGIDAGYSHRESRDHVDDTYEIKFETDNNLKEQFKLMTSTNHVVAVNYHIPLVHLIDPNQTR